jgi:gliding motility-associated-like protein
MLQFFLLGKYRKWLFSSYLLFFFIILPITMMAEGSKEITANGGSRAFLLSSNISNISFPFPTLGTMKVFVKAGETVYVGSSAQGLGFGTINLRAPDGSTYSSGTSTTVGLIANRAQEVAGPSPNAGGYTPFTRTATAAQEGVWEIDFISPSNGIDQESSPATTPAGGSWSQPISQYIAAFDVTVRDVSNTTFLSGRVFTNIFSGILSSYQSGFNGIMHILTKDGYQYMLDNNGQAGNGFSFFVNNKGFRASDGSASYLSVNSTLSPNVQDPRAPDTQTDITHKIFFNNPAADLPATAKTPSGGPTWLMNPPFVPTMNNTGFIGTEGLQNKAGTTPLGGTILFTATANGTYTIIIDVNKNGILTDPIDRKLTGTVKTGDNTVAWDGLDGLGNKVPASTVDYPVNISVLLYSAEIHFPFFDVERNVNGLKLTRTNGNNLPDNNMYWDDSQITVVGTPPNPITNLTGINSLVNGHKWGAFNADPNNEDDFGNSRGIDSWAYVITPPIVASVNFNIREADLEVVSIDANSGCVGQKANYTVVVRNNGPSDVTGSTFAFTFPTELSSPVITSAQTAGTTVVSNESTTANLYKATLDMTNGAVRTFTITGTVTGVPSSGTLDVTASILRPTDVTDPDATNPDNAVPTDPLAECNAAPSGTGCNNIKTNSTTFALIPKAGADTVVMQNTVATLTANTTGTWAQLGNSPTVANIASPTTATTNVTGLTTIGTYTFIYSNTNGCADTVNVIVASSDNNIHNVFTPNGDGKNDTFTVDGSPLYPSTQLLIFNRWGNEVYRSEGYANSWDGKGMAEGTYYYTVNRKNKKGLITTFKGWVYLKR